MNVQHPTTPSGTVQASLDDSTAATKVSQAAPTQNGALARLLAEPVPSPKETTARFTGGPGAKNAAKVICPHGHWYTEANTIWRPNGGRRCKRCYNDARERRRKRAEARRWRAIWELPA